MSLNISLCCFLASVRLVSGARPVLLEALCVFSVRLQQDAGNITISIIDGVRGDVLRCVLSCVILASVADVSISRWLLYVVVC